MKIYIQNHNWKHDYDFEQENKREVIYSEENILILKKKNIIVKKNYMNIMKQKIINHILCYLI